MSQSGCNSPVLSSPIGPNAQEPAPKRVRWSADRTPVLGREELNSAFALLNTRAKNMAAQKHGSQNGTKRQMEPTPASPWLFHVEQHHIQFNVWRGTQKLLVAQMELQETHVHSKSCVQAAKDLEPARTIGSNQRVACQRTSPELFFSKRVERATIHMYVYIYIHPYIYLYMHTYIEYNEHALPK